MSAIIEFAIFPIDNSQSKSKYVARVIDMIRQSGYEYILTPMGTIIETKSVDEGLEIVKKAYEILEIDSDRIYSAIKIDYKPKAKMGRLSSKVDSVNDKLKS